jgi:hypothetical protein
LFFFQREIVKNVITASFVTIIQSRPDCIQDQSQGADLRRIDYCRDESFLGGKEGLDLVREVASDIAFALFGIEIEEQNGRHLWLYKRLRPNIMIYTKMPQ